MSGCVCCTLRIRSVAPQNERKWRRIFAMAISFALRHPSDLYNGINIYIYLIVTSTLDNVEASIIQAISKDLRAPAKENSKESEATQNMYNNKKRKKKKII